MVEQTCQDPIRILLVGDYASTENPREATFNEATQVIHQLAGKAWRHITVDTVSVRSFDITQAAAAIAKAAQCGAYDAIYDNRIVASGYGEPPESVKERMRSKYGWKG